MQSKSVYIIICEKKVRIALYNIVGTYLACICICFFHKYCSLDNWLLNDFYSGNNKHIFELFSDEKQGNLLIII